MRTLLALAGCASTVAALLPVVPAPSTTPTGTHPCATSTASCEGRLTVPLDRTDPGGPTVSVAFAWHPRRDHSRPADGTVLVNLGGPAPTIAPADRYDEVLGSVRDRQDLLLIDPRGHGRSTPLTCSGLDPAVPDTVRACAERLGPRVAHFGTAEVADDIEAVRAALGIDQLSLFGNSYGTAVLPAYAVRYPARVRAMFLDSVMTHDDSGYVRDPLAITTAFRSGMADLALLCRRSAHCRRLPGEPGGRLRELTAKLRVAPDPEVPLQLLAMLHIQLFDPAYGREVNAAVHAYLAGDLAPLRRLVSAVGRTWHPEPPDPAMAGILATLCADARYPYARAAAPEEKYRQLVEHYRQRQPFRPFRTGEVMPPGIWDYLNACASWPTAQESPVLLPDAGFSAIPTLVVTGDLDTTTPEDGGRDLAARIPGATYVEVPGGTHSMALARPRAPSTLCVRRLAQAFLVAPDNPIHHPRCDARTARALGEFPRTAQQLPPARADGLGAADRSLLAAAHATAADAVVRLDPGATYTAMLDHEAGLRAGIVRYAEGRMSCTLEQVRFVNDLTVDGTVVLDPAFDATATLTVTSPDGAAHRIQLTWPALAAGPNQQVTGTLDGAPFRAVLPAF